MNEYLMQLRADERFIKLINEIKEQSPIVPNHDYLNDNTEEMKALSNRKLGFELALTYFGEEL